MAAEWERIQARAYLLAGKAKGATIAAWKQVARAEVARAMQAAYGQALLDLVKAFERRPHALLLREAEALGYPLWLFRLALTTYRLELVLRVGQAASAAVIATRGITAGSGSATIEMRLAIIRIVDKAATMSPANSLTLFVDGLGIEPTG